MLWDVGISLVMARSPLSGISTIMCTQSTFPTMNAPVELMKWLGSVTNQVRWRFADRVWAAQGLRCRRRSGGLAQLWTYGTDALVSGRVWHHSAGDDGLMWLVLLCWGGWDLRGWRWCSFFFSFFFLGSWLVWCSMERGRLREKRVHTSGRRHGWHLADPAKCWRWRSECGMVEFFFFFVGETYL